ncbi:pyrroline-5-carboxylate reductase dimerization-domain-containing protein [Lipomyces japonicus]|uniref:pyrroline-5-carboxylate reductase dimerization-domain-containing protein n=1 Tax=Lipomyces japonicus TaxID=56871 RepID=UPI0034CE5473
MTAAEVTIPLKYTICMLACGTMNSAVLAGVLDSLASGSTPSGTDAADVPVPTRFLCCVKRDESAARLRGQFGESVEVYQHDHASVVRQADVVVLGCKPQLLDDVLSGRSMQEALRGKILISVLAGKTLRQIQQVCGPDTYVIRAMPNTPAKIRQGMTVISFPTLPSPSSSVASLADTLPAVMAAPVVRPAVQWVFSQVGRALVLDEKHIDACTALSGSGPAFACVMLEAMTDGGVMMGLPFAVAQELAAQTMQGAARMVLDGNHPAQIRNAVTTPGGCTIGGLLVMEDGKIRSTIARSIQEATNIASSLGKK